MHSIVMCWFLFGIIFIQSFVNIDAVSAERLALIQLEKLVAELKASHEIQCHKLSEIQSENSHFKEKMKEIYEDNKHLKGKIRNLLDENREQKKINSQLKKEITEIKTLLKSSEFKELFKLKSTVLQSKTVADPDWHLNYDNKSVNTTGTNSFKPGIIQRAEAVNSSGRTSSKRLLLTSNQPVASNGGVAFFAYLSTHEPNPGSHKTFIFDVDHTNIGGHYSHHTGVFTCPIHGVYVFSWSIYCNTGGYVYSELVVNSSPVSGKFVGAINLSFTLSSMDLAIVELNAGDEVYIRTPPNHAASGQVLSDPQYRSTFSGWKLF